MKALVRTVYGGPENLAFRETETPVPQAKEILVNVKARTISRTDCGVLWGEPKIIRLFTGLGKPKNTIPGTDFAGEVTKVGAAVDRFKVGDRVFGLNDVGLQSHAEYLVIKQNDAVEQIPDGVDYEEAAASLEGGHYAYNYIRKMGMQGNHQILVNGGTGAIGSTAIQMLKALGAYVVATAPTKHIDKVKALGADKIIDFEREDFTKTDEKFHFVFDSVGKSNFGKCKPIMLDGGIYVSSELGPGAENLYLPILTLFSKRKVKFPTPTKRRESVKYISELLSAGKFNPLIDKVVSPDDIVEAFHYVNAGKKIGNVILEF
jgi:NADPH:quinone reductase-like Zn-dependent oxidoreductase